MILTVLRQGGDLGVHCGDPECDGGHAFLAMLDDGSDALQACICGPDATGEAPGSRPDCPGCDRLGVDIGEDPF